MFPRLSKLLGKTPDPAPSIDIFRPHHEPARSLYDTFQREAKLRAGRPPEVWIEAELQAMHTAATAVAQARGWPTPDRALIERAETYARGSADYGSKWTYRILDLMEQANR